LFPLIPNRLPTKGKPIESLGSRPIAKRNYATFWEKRSHRAERVETWLADSLAILKGAEKIRTYIQAGQVEATLWVAIIGPHLVAEPNISPDIQAELGQLSVRLLIENYTDLAGGNAKQTWFPNP
jgi:hypothetical protein